MNAAADPATGEGPATAAPSPGALLKLARERAGLGVDDLAAQIKLARNTLEALERDDFAGLSEPVYVRGYYRKIAKTLGIQDKELLDAYDSRNPAHAAPLRPQPLPLAGGVDAGISRRAQGQGFLIAAGIVGLALVAIFLFAEPPRTARLPKPVAEPEVPAAVIDPAATATAPSAESANGATAGVLEKDSMSPALAPGTSPALAPGASPAAADPASTASGSQLVLQFNESSFVRVEDSRGRTLLIGLVRGGEQPVLDGQPPYTVFLGNARGVRVFRKGQAVDFSADVNAQNDTARFTVP